MAFANTASAYQVLKSHGRSQLQGTSIQRSSNIGNPQKGARLGGSGRQSHSFIGGTAGSGNPRARAERTKRAQSAQLRASFRARTGHDPGPTLQNILGSWGGKLDYQHGINKDDATGKWTINFPDQWGIKILGGRRWRPPTPYTVSKVNRDITKTKSAHSANASAMTVTTLEGVKKLDPTSFKPGVVSSLFKKKKPIRRKL